MLGEIAFERRESDVRIAGLTADVDDAKVNYRLFVYCCTIVAILHFVCYHTAYYGRSSL
jgi:hypothetical protein